MMTSTRASVLLTADRISANTAAPCTGGGGGNDHKGQRTAGHREHFGTNVAWRSPDKPSYRML